MTGVIDVGTLSEVLDGKGFSLYISKQTRFAIQEKMFLVEGAVRQITNNQLGLLRQGISGFCSTLHGMTKYHVKATSTSEKSPSYPVYNMGATLPTVLRGLAEIAVGAVIVCEDFTGAEKLLCNVHNIKYLSKEEAGGIYG